MALHKGSFAHRAVVCIRAPAGADGPQVGWFGECDDDIVHPDGQGRTLLIVWTDLGGNRAVRRKSRPVAHQWVFRDGEMIGDYVEVVFPLSIVSGRDAISGQS